MGHAVFCAVMSGMALAFALVPVKEPTPVHDAILFAGAAVMALLGIIFAIHDSLAAHRRQR